MFFILFFIKFRKFCNIVFIPIGIPINTDQKFHKNIEGNVTIKQVQNFKHLCVSLTEVFPSVKETCYLKASRVVEWHVFSALKPPEEKDLFQTPERAKVCQEFIIHFPRPSVADIISCFICSLPYAIFLISCATKWRQSVSQDGAQYMHKAIKTCPSRELCFQYINRYCIQTQETVLFCSRYWDN